MSFDERWENTFAEACNEAVLHFMEADRVYKQRVKRRAELSSVIEMLVEEDGDFHMTAAQRKSVAEYLTLLTGEKELETLMVCYMHGMRDCVKLLRRLDVLKK